MCAKKTVKHRVPRTRNNYTMTESMFWGGIRSALRQKSRYWWTAGQAVKLEARRLYKGPNKRQKWEYQCAKCKDWFMEKEVHIDHIIPAGTLTCSEDLAGFVERLFCEKEGFALLCTDCHSVKTNEERKSWKGSKK